MKVKTKKLATLGVLALVVLIYGVIGFAADKPDLYAEITEVKYGSWEVCVKYTDPNNNPPAFMYFVIEGKAYPAEYPEVKENWALYKDYFVEKDPSDTDFTDGKWYCYKYKLDYEHYGRYYAHFYASDGTTMVEFPRVDWMDLVFGNVRPRVTPYPYPYPYPYPG